MTDVVELDIAHLRIAYGRVPAVWDVSLRVRSGEVVALLGSNGAGKSTTAKTVAGILPASGGEIRLAGQSILNRPSHEIVERGISLVPEGRLVFPEMTVLENLQLGASARRVASRIQQNLDYVFELFPRLGERSKQNAGSLSGGEQQMLAIGRGLMSSPRIIILDEPSLGLMPKLVLSLFDLIGKIRDAGVGVLLVEQNVFQSLNIADRAYVIQKGTLWREGAGDELLRDPEIRQAFLGM
ncbi:ABC transporter ATP-binding protein [Corticibacterium sp. UT-5YL-CI-8]|nr:ABC transporter ATP-binding protein [Tianweitania sp. UT-5YL-CI-8]